MDEVVGRLAAWSLPGAPSLDPPTDLPGALDLVDAARLGGLLGPLLAAVDAGDARFPAAARAYLVEQHARVQRWCVTVEHRLLASAAALAEAGIEPLVLKGSAVAHLDVGDPALRSFSDVDLLVPAADLPVAAQVLYGVGVRRAFPERRAGFDQRFAKSVTLTAPDGVEIDLHRSLVDGAHGFRIPLDDLFADAVAFDLAGRSLRALGPIHRFLHAAYHATLGSPAPRAVNVRDVAGHLADPRTALADVVAEVARWRGELVLATAVAETLAATGLPAPAWEAWATEAIGRSRRRERRILARQRIEGSGLGRGKVDALRELPWADRPTYLAALLAPDRDHLAARGLRRWHLPGRVRRRGGGPA